MSNLGTVKSLILIVSTALLGGLIGFTMKGEKPLVAYVSQEEIVGFEKARINSITENDKKQMFFGKPKEAARLIENLASSREDKNTIVVFSAGKVYGDDVISISRDVYDEAITSLEKEPNNTDEDLK